MKYKNPFIHGTMVIKKSVIEEVGLYNESFYYSQDGELWLRLLDNNRKIFILPQFFIKICNSYLSLRAQSYLGHWSDA